MSKIHITPGGTVKEVFTDGRPTITASPEDIFPGCGPQLASISMSVIAGILLCVASPTLLQGALDITSNDLSEAIGLLLGYVSISGVMAIGAGSVAYVLFIAFGKSRGK